MRRRRCSAADAPSRRLRWWRIARGGGDPEALYAVANWRLFALHGPRDLPAAHEFLSRAAALGHVDAIRIRAHLLANGTGCAADPAGAERLLGTIADRDQHAALQLAFLPRTKSAAEARKAPRERLSADPAAELIRGLLGREECAYVMTLAEPALTPSVIVDPQGRRLPHPVRTSYGMSFGPTGEDLVVNRINCRLAEATATAPECGEPLHILRYRHGQEYRPHVDALPGAANQRDWTVLVYLNEDYVGGETVFPELGLSVRGRAGDALVFRNTGADGLGDPRSRHAGLPVTSGTKWLATRWIRRRPYHPWEP